MSLSYYYFNDRNGPSIGFPYPDLDPPVNALTDTTNPLYNFGQDFVTKFQSLNPVDVAQALPYISMCSLDVNGDVVTDFNVSFFQKAVDMNKVSGPNRYADRPQLSLSDLSISETLAAGGGLISWTNVTMNFKLHKPDFVTSNALISLLFSGLPMRIVYGWSTVGKNDFLGTKAVLLFNLRDYNLTFDQSGQAMLTLNGLGHADNFSSVHVGDEAVEISDFSVGTVPNNLLDETTPEVPDVQQDNLYYSQQRTSQFVSYANTLALQSEGGTRDKNVLDFMGTLYYDIADTISENTKQRFFDSLQQLSQKKKSCPVYFPNDIKRKNQDGTTSFAECVTVHEIVSILCGDTLEKLQGTLIPADREYRVVYGTFNENAGSWALNNIAEFPIHWLTFNEIFKEINTNGMPVPTLSAIFRILSDQFLGNQQYWRECLIKKDDQSKIDFPKVSCRVTSHYATSTADTSGNTPEIIQICLYDTNFKVPFTQLQLENISSPMTEQAQIDACVGNPPTIPVIRFGNANGFIKSITMESFSDPTYKTYLMNRYSGLANTRFAFTANALAPPVAKKAPFIPFKGSMDVIGHVDWKVGRYFYLASGIFFVDGVYLITEVNETLDNNGFRTTISFSRH